MRKRALLIGIDDYPYLGDLQYAQADAMGVAKSLQKNYSFDESEICLMTGKTGLNAPTLTNIETQLQHVKNVYHNLDFFLVGIWGHGYLSPDQSSRYFCLSDSRVENLAKTALTYEFLNSYLKMIGAQNTCLILDSCQTIGTRGNPIQIEEAIYSHNLGKFAEDTTRDITASRSNLGYPTFIPASFAVLDSCMPNQQAHEDTRYGHGLFTAHLLAGMERKLDSIGRWSRYVSRHVTEEASATGRNQTPIFKLSGAGDIDLEELVVPGRPQTRSEDFVDKKPVPQPEKKERETSSDFEIGKRQEEQPSKSETSKGFSRVKLPAYQVITPEDFPSFPDYTLPEINKTIAMERLYNLLEKNKARAKRGFWNPRRK